MLFDEGDKVLGVRGWFEAMDGDELRSESRLEIDKCLKFSIFLHEQWLWRSGHFLHQRSAVRIQSFAIYLLSKDLNWIKRQKERKIEAGNGQIKKYMFLHRQVPIDY